MKLFWKANLKKGYTLFAVRPWFKPSLCHALTVSPWAHWSVTESFSFHKWKIVIATLPDFGKGKKSILLKNINCLGGGFVPIMKYSINYAFLPFSEIHCPRGVPSHIQGWIFCSEGLSSFLHPKKAGLLTLCESVNGLIYSLWNVTTSQVLHVLLS